VTGAAGTYYLRVIDIKCGCPYIWVVAILAHVGRRDMRGALADSFHTIMAADAVASDIHMIKVGGYPAGRRMTVIAIFAAGNMGRVFAGCCDAVMARAAGTKHLRVIDSASGFKGHGAVAVFTDIRR